MKRYLLCISALLILCPQYLFAQAAPVDSARSARIKSETRVILSQPEYSPVKPNVSPFQIAGQWVGKIILRFFRWLSGLGSNINPPTKNFPLMPWILLTMAILLLLWFIFICVRAWTNRPPTSPRWKKKKAVLGVEIEPEEGIDMEPDPWLETSKRYAKEGDMRGAYRAAFIALILRLDKRGSLHYERSRTNGEYLRALHKSPDLYALIKPLAETFDISWYGRRPVAEADYALCLDTYNRLSDENRQVRTN